MINKNEVIYVLKYYSIKYIHEWGSIKVVTKISIEHGYMQPLDMKQFILCLFGETVKWNNGYIF